MISSNLIPTPTPIMGALDALKVASEGGGEWLPSKGKDLRAQALELLSMAQSLDGLKPYSITHRHAAGEGVYLLWSKDAPTLDEILSILGCVYEPERDETLQAEVVFSLGDLVGLPAEPGVDQREVGVPIDAMG